MHIIIDFIFSCYLQCSPLGRHIQETRLFSHVTKLNHSYFWSLKFKRNMHTCLTNILHA